MAALAAGPAFGEVNILTPTGGEVLSAGSVVEVSWEGLDQDVEEMELLLLVAENAPVHVRLTPQLAGSRRSFLWQIPNLPSREARLRLRWGRGGVETESPPSASFTIRADTSLPVEAIRRRNGEYWIGATEFDPHPILDATEHLADPDPLHMLLATISLVSETTNELDECRIVDRSQLSWGLAETAQPQPEISAHRPLTIPLRP